jgi:hypothetical protein
VIPISWHILIVPQLRELPNFFGRFYLLASFLGCIRNKAWIILIKAL